VATQTIQRRKKLVGFDVIHVHRLLKNPVELPEYLLVTDELARIGGKDPAELGMHEVSLDLEGIGEVRSHYLDVADIAAPPQEPSWPSRIGGTFAMVGRGLPYAFGRRRPAAVSAA
jgi:hypothetical protein